MFRPELELGNVLPQSDANPDAGEFKRREVAKLLYMPGGLR